MKKNILLTVCAALVLLTTGAFMVEPADLAPTVVSYTVLTIDSAVGGGYWAYDTTHRVVTITPTDVNEYLVTFVDTGTFVSWAGKSPGNTGTIGDNVIGTIVGGQVLTVNGVLKDSLPADLGFIDYQCDHFANCSNYTSWINLLFESGASSKYLQWGWTYATCNNGIWVNADKASGGNVGDITGEYKPCAVAAQTELLSTEAYLTLTLSPSGGFIAYDGTATSHGCFLLVPFGAPGDSAMNTFCGAVPTDINDMTMLSGRVYQRYPGDLWGVWEDDLGNNLDEQLKTINQDNGWMLQRMGLFTSTYPLTGGLWLIDHLMY